MKWIFCLLGFISFIANGQALKEINFRYLYNHEEPVYLQVRPVREVSGWKCFYSLTFRDSLLDRGEFAPEWELRKSLSDSQGTRIKGDSIKSLSASARQGALSFPLSPDVQFAVAKIKRADSQKTYYFYSTLDPNYPETEPLFLNGAPLLNSFVNVGSNISLKNSATYIVSYYNDNFPAAPPAFSETLGKVPKKMTVDSTYSINGGQSIPLSITGLYLFQKDTTRSEGIALRVEDDYPRYAKIKSIAEPLIYICTSQEFSRIKQAMGDKKAFDRVILSITKDSERAKKMMRNYFKRVEIANQFFTSYKEGWKTDRGMIYIVFGIPDEVFRYSDREVWNYTSTDRKTTFEFVKSPSLFDPDNYVLARNKKYAEIWYEMIDLWRNARF